MPPTKRPHAERPYLNEPVTDVTRAALHDLLLAHGLRGVVEALAGIYADKAKDVNALSISGRATATRTARVLEMTLDSIPLQVR